MSEALIGLLTVITVIAALALLGVRIAHRRFVAAHAELAMRVLSARAEQEREQSVTAGEAASMVSIEPGEGLSADQLAERLEQALKADAESQVRRAEGRIRQVEEEALREMRERISESITRWSRLATARKEPAP
jgi:hypothetical protein